MSPRILRIPAGRHRELDIVQAARGGPVRLGFECRGGEVLLDVHVRHAGGGPRLLVVGGTHGDEFEGQIVVAELARSLPVLDMAGTLICVPRHNALACAAGQRCAPGESLDLNRAYDGDMAGSVEGEVARIVSEALLPQVDWLIDLHSGGRTHEFVLSSNVQARIGGDEDVAMRPYLQAFAAPFSLVFDETGTNAMPHRGTLEGAARRLGVRALSSELGGAGGVTPASMAVARRGLMNVLARIGTLAPERIVVPAEPPILLRLDDPSQTVAPPGPGLFEPLLPLGARVSAGEALAHVHPDDPTAAPAIVEAPCDGVLAALFVEGRTRPDEPVAIVCPLIE